MAGLRPGLLPAQARGPQARSARRQRAARQPLPPDSVPGPRAGQGRRHDDDAHGRRSCAGPGGGGGVLSGGPEAAVHPPQRQPLAGGGRAVRLHRGAGSLSGLLRPAARHPRRGPPQLAASDDPPRGRHPGRRSRRDPARGRRLRGRGRALPDRRRRDLRRSGGAQGGAPVAAPGARRGTPLRDCARSCHRAPRRHAPVSRRDAGRLRVLGRLPQRASRRRLPRARAREAPDGARRALPRRRLPDRLGDPALRRLAAGLRRVHPRLLRAQRGDDDRRAGIPAVLPLPDHRRARLPDRPREHRLPARGESRPGPARGQCAGHAGGARRPALGLRPRLPGSAADPGHRARDQGARLRVRLAARLRLPRGHGRSPDRDRQGRPRHQAARFLSAPVPRRAATRNIARRPGPRSDSPAAQQASLQPGAGRDPGGDRRGRAPRRTSLLRDAPRADPDLEAQRVPNARARGGAAAPGQGRHPLEGQRPRRGGIGSGEPRQRLPCLRRRATRDSRSLAGHRHPGQGRDPARAPRRRHAHERRGREPRVPVGARGRPADPRRPIDAVRGSGSPLPGWHDPGRTRDRRRAGGSRAEVAPRGGRRSASAFPIRA